VGRRRFAHLHAELSVAVGRVVPRFALWLAVAGGPGGPERLTREAVLAFAREGLPEFLHAHRLSLDVRSARRLRRRLARFDPDRPTPEEVLERMVAAR